MIVTISFSALDTLHCTLHPALIEWECVRHEGVRFVLLQQPQRVAEWSSLGLKCVIVFMYLSVCVRVRKGVLLPVCADTFVCLKHSINIYELQYFPIPIYTI